MSESPRLEELRRRVQADPASIAFAALAEEYRRAGKFREAVDTSRAGLRHHPTYVSARVTLGRSLVELQEFEQAERELAFVLRSAPDNLAARRALGELCWQRLRFADALTHFCAARVLAPNDTELPAIIGSIERELEAERAAATPAEPETSAPEVGADTNNELPGASEDESVPLAAIAAESAAESADDESVDAAVAAGADGVSADADAGPAAHAVNGRANGSPVIAALERFYRAIVRAREVQAATASDTDGVSARDSRSDPPPPPSAHA